MWTVRIDVGELMDFAKRRQSWRCQKLFWHGSRKLRLEAGVKGGRRIVDLYVSGNYSM
jgi:hypothetical protein